MNTRSEKTPGQLAYEEDCRRCPRYDDGAPRSTWEKIGQIARDSWERNPTPRSYNNVITVGKKPKK